MAKKIEALESELEEMVKGEPIGRIASRVLMGLVLVALVALVGFNISYQPPAKDKVWDLAMTIGDPEAKKHYVMYTDIMCPYCDVFSRNVANNRQEFEEKYLKKEGILFEMRITDFLSEYVGHYKQESRDSAEGAYCAAKEGKFWDYYYGAIDKLWQDFHSKGIGTGRTAPAIKGINEDYWIKIGQSKGLGEEFKRCMQEDWTVAKIKENTEKTARVSQGGVPFFQFGKFTTGGFDQSWDWERTKQLLDAGL